MAKGGSGDMLTGIIAGLLAQFKDDAHGQWRRRCICRVLRRILR